MPISVKVFDDVYTVLQCVGEVCLDDFVKANDYIYSELDEKISQFQIVDIDAAAKIEMSEKDLIQIADQDSHTARNLQYVIVAVVAPNDFAFGLSRIWGAYADTPGVTTAVFRESAIAHDWIKSMRKKLTEQGK